jgi:putative tryptophan/tyrosine transport system substrate-binding protein
VRSRRYAAELVALAPDVVLAGASEATAALREVTRTVPIVFAGVTDPVGAGYVASLARPGGNATGLAYVEYGMGGNGWNYSRRLRHMLLGQQFFAILLCRRGWAR